MAPTPDLRIATGDDWIEILLVGIGPEDDGYRWLEVELRASVGAFRAHMDETLELSDLVALRHALEQIESGTACDAVFTALEEWIELRLRIDHRGTVRVAGMLDDSSHAARLDFEFYGGMGIGEVRGLIRAVQDIEARAASKKQAEL